MEVKIGQVWVDPIDGEAAKIIGLREDGDWDIEIIRNFNNEARDRDDRIMKFGNGFEENGAWVLDEITSVQEILNNYEER